MPDKEAAKMGRKKRKIRVFNTSITPHKSCRIGHSAWRRALRLPFNTDDDDGQVIMLGSVTDKLVDPVDNFFQKLIGTH